MRKPSLTEQMMELLEELADYAEAQATELTEGTDDDLERQENIRKACDWIVRLGMWKHSQRKRAKRKSDPVAKALRQLDQDDDSGGYYQ